MIFALRHKPTGKYASKAIYSGYNNNSDHSRKLVDLHMACFWGRGNNAAASLKQRENPSEWEIVAFELVEV